MAPDVREPESPSPRLRIRIQRINRRRWSLGISGEGNSPRRLGVFGRGICIFVGSDIVVTFLSIGVVQRVIQAGDNFLPVILAMALLLATLGVGQYRWWQREYVTLFKNADEDDTNLDSS